MSPERKVFPAALAKNNPVTWFTTSELLEYLGISQEELDTYQDMFIEDVHFRKVIVSNAQTSLVWRIDLIDELLCLPIPALEREAMQNAIENRITCQS